MAAPPSASTSTSPPRPTSSTSRTACIEAVEKARDLPQFQGIQILVVGNQADSIRESLSELRKAGLIGAVLSFFMLLFFLRHLPTTLIVSLAVPASLLVTLAAMYFLGFTLNILTMMGMLLAIGMLVDNSVVITESIFRHRQLHPGHPLESTLAGVKEVGVATLAGTFSMIIVFLPLVFGERNQMSIFLVHVAVPIIVAMLASLVIAQTLLPMLAARMSPPPPVKDGSWFSRLQDRYERALNWALTHRKWMALITVLIVLSPVPLFALKLTKVDPFPQEASRVLLINYHLEGSHPLERVEVGGQAGRGLHRGQQGTLRRRHLLLVLAIGPGQHAPVPHAQERGQGVARGSHGTRDEGHAGDHHRQAQLHVRRQHGRFVVVQPATCRRIDRAPRGHLARGRAPPVIGAGARSRALRSRHGRAGSAGRS